MRLPEEQKALDLAQKITDFSDELVLVLSMKDRWKELKEEVDSIFTEPDPVEPIPQVQKPREVQKPQKRGPGRPSKKDKEREKFEQEMLNQSKATEDM